MISREEYERRFKAQIVARRGGSYPYWKQDLALDAAEAEWDNFSGCMEDSDLPGSPEEAADKCLEDWGDSDAAAEGEIDAHG